MVLVKALELVVADAAGHCRHVVHVGLGDHRRHGGVDVPGFELISAMRLPKGDEVVVGHEPVLSVLRPHSETTGGRYLGDHLI